METLDLWWVKPLRAKHTLSFAINSPTYKANWPHARSAADSALIWRLNRTSPYDLHTRHSFLNVLREVTKQPDVNEPCWKILLPKHIENKPATVTLQDSVAM